VTSPARPRPTGEPDDEALDRARRVATMLDRWAAEDVSSDPEWDVEQIAPLVVRERDPREQR